MYGLSSRDYVTRMHKNSAFVGLVFISAFLITGTCGELTHKPENATLRPGSTLRLSCRSTISDTPVAWYFTKEGLDTRQEMTIGGSLKPNFSDLFTIDSSNKYDLEATMTSDPEQYCGTYECVDNNGDRQAEKASASVATVNSSPTCNVNPKSASGSDEVTFTCSVTVCGSASVPLSIKSGTNEESGTNTVTWKTTADNVQDTDVTCSADFGNADTCPKLTTSVASAIDLPALSVYAMFAIVAHRLSM